MRALIGVVALCTGIVRWSPAQDVSRIAPGMTKAEVYQIFGAPAVVRTVGEHTYYYYPNGCEKKCGIPDLVVFRRGQVADAVLRAPGREYAGTSSSPRGVRPGPGTAATAVEQVGRAEPESAAEVGGIAPVERAPPDRTSRDTLSLSLPTDDAPPQAVQDQAKPRVGSHVPDEAKRLVVQVIGYFAGSDAPEIGAGIIVGATSKNVFIATARHVIARGAVGLRDLRVLFPGEPHDSVRATPLRGSRTGLDLAVISAPIASARALKGELPALDRRGDVRALKSGAPVSPVGCPKGVCWEAPTPPDRILGIDLQGIIFQTSFIDAGSSGGALFNQWWEVVGLVTEETPPRGEAIPIDQVVDQVRYWGYPVDLKKTAVPRGGYRTSVGAALLAPSPAVDDRPPSGRLTLSSRPIPQVSWHAGLLRLAPENLAVTAGVVGVGLHLKKGRFALHPFVEAGFGHMEAQFDIGGYYVATGGDTSYVPVFNRVEDDGLGVGGGAAVELTVLPRTILELVTGYWRFTRPENAPQLNELFVGAGLRVGL